MSQTVSHWLCIKGDCPANKYTETGASIRYHYAQARWTNKIYMYAHNLIAHANYDIMLPNLMLYHRTSRAVDVCVCVCLLFIHGIWLIKLSQKLGHHTQLQAGYDNLCCTCTQVWLCLRTSVRTKYPTMGSINTYSEELWQKSAKTVLYKRSTGLYTRTVPMYKHMESTALTPDSVCEIIL